MWNLESLYQLWLHYHGWICKNPAWLICCGQCLFYVITFKRKLQNTQQEPLNHHLLPLFTSSKVVCEVFNLRYHSKQWLYHHGSSWHLGYTFILQISSIFVASRLIYWLNKRCYDSVDVMKRYIWVFYTYLSMVGTQLYHTSRSCRENNVSFLILDIID